MRASSLSGPTSTGYTLNLRAPDRNLYRFTLNNFPGQTPVGAQAANIYAMDFDSPATTLYALNSSTDQLGTLSITTGAFTDRGLPAPDRCNLDRLEHRSNDGCLLRFDGGQPVHARPDHLFADVGRAVRHRQRHHDRHRGQPGRRDVRARHLHRFDLHHRHRHRRGDLVGPTGLPANFAQGMDFDNEDGTLYIFLYQGSGANVYGTVNLATGAVTALATNSPTGEFEGATRTLGLCIPNDIPWLSTAPITGTVAAMASPRCPSPSTPLAWQRAHTPASSASAATIRTEAAAAGPAWCKCRWR